MASNTEIANGALTLVGQLPITDLLTDDSERADILRVTYERTKSYALTRYPWSFANQTVVLVADSIAQNPRFTYSFQLPAGYLGVVSSSLDDLAAEFHVEDKRLVTDESAVILTYTLDVPESAFSPGFSLVLEHLLASRVAFALTKDRLLVRELVRIYRELLQDEINRDSMVSERGETYIFPDFLDVRQG